MAQGHISLSRCLGRPANPRQHLESLLPDGVPPGSEIQAPSANSAASAHAWTVRSVRQGTRALRQVADHPAPGRGPSAPVQRAPPPVIIAVIGARIGANTLFGDSVGDSTYRPIRSALNGRFKG
jgi:hypothetical protein